MISHLEALEHRFLGGEALPLVVLLALHHLVVDEVLALDRLLNAEVVEDIQATKCYLLGTNEY